MAAPPLTTLVWLPYLAIQCSSASPCSRVVEAKLLLVATTMHISSTCCRHGFSSGAGASATSSNTCRPGGACQHVDCRELVCGRFARWRHVLTAGLQRQLRGARLAQTHATKDAAAAMLLPPHASSMQCCCCCGMGLPCSRHNIRSHTPGRAAPAAPHCLMPGLLARRAGVRRAAGGRQAPWRL